MDEMKLRELQHFFKSEEFIVVAYLFGSAAKGVMGGLSDVDVAVLLSKSYNATLDYRLYLIDKLAQIVRRAVDIVVLNEASPLLRYEVVKYGRVLYCRDEGERVAFEERTIDEYLDMGRIEKEYLGCLLQSER